MQQHLSTITRLQRERRARGAALPADLFREPCWDMLLDLAHHHAQRRLVSVSSLCIASGAPHTTALRYIDTLRTSGLVDRVPDPMDARRVFVGFTGEGCEAMEAYLASVAGEAR